MTVAQPATPRGRPPVLLVHGMWHAGWAWENWMGYLAERGYASYALDLRGHGRSEGDLRAASLADHLDDVRRAIAALRERPVLVGHSLGGLLVLHLLAGGTYPAAVLVASVPGRYPPGVAVREAARDPVAAAATLLFRDLRPYVRTVARSRRTLFTDATPQDIVRATHARLAGASPRLVGEMLISPPQPPRPGTPTLVIAATRDPLFGGGRPARLARRLGATLAEIEGSGHDIPLDARWADASRTAVDWLESAAVLRACRAEKLAEGAFERLDHR